MTPFLDENDYRVVARYDFATGGFRIVILSPFGDELYTSSETLPNPYTALASGRGLIADFVRRLAGHTDYRPAA